MNKPGNHHFKERLFCFPCVAKGFWLKVMLQAVRLTFCLYASMQRFLFVNTVVSASFHGKSFQNQESKLLCLSQKSWHIAIKVTQCINRRCHNKDTSIQALISGIGWINICVKLSVYRVCLSKPFDIDFATWSSAGSLRPHSDTVKKIPGLRPGHVLKKDLKSS